MIRNLLVNAVCPSESVCFYARNRVPCEQALWSALVAARAKEGGEVVTSRCHGTHSRTKRKSLIIIQIQDALWRS